MKNNLCTFYIVRHGETEWNRKKMVMGHLDSSLTKEGIAQVKSVASLFAPLNFSAAYVSDLPRAIQTAEIIFEGRSALSIHTSQKLRERNFGRYEGMLGEAYGMAVFDSRAQKSVLPVLEQWKFMIGGAVESDESVVSRLMEELHRIAALHFGETVLVVTHGGPIRMLLMKLEVMPYGSLPPGSFANSGYLIVTFDGSTFDVKHVEGIKKSHSYGKTKNPGGSHIRG